MQPILVEKVAPDLYRLADGKLLTKQELERLQKIMPEARFIVFTDKSEK